MNKSPLQRLEDRYIDCCAEFGDDSEQAQSVLRQVDKAKFKEFQTTMGRIKTGEIALSPRRNIGDLQFDGKEISRIGGEPEPKIVSRSAAASRMRIIKRMR